jgi:tetratricopeptide (TPR) repeat protein
MAHEQRDPQAAGAASTLPMDPASPPSGGSTLPAPAAERAPCFVVGDSVGGRYRVLHFIARGGMGEVYEALDEELHLRVALKAVAERSGSALTRFRREVTLARRVTHRNVCRIYEIGFQPVGEETVPFCSMELLSGPSLATRLLRGPLDPAEALPLVRQMAAGLLAAHEAGVVHRDLKSSNVMLVPDAGGGVRAVITDFGLARAEASCTGEGALVVTSDQSMLGTPAYMAPEQVEGKPVSPATDVYALGVVMFEMLTGELPFRAESPLRTATLRLTEPPPSPASRRPGLDPRWNAVILRCLAREPTQRFARATDVVAALEAGPPAVRRGRTLRALALLVGLAALAVLLAARTARAPAGLASGRIPVTAAGASGRTLLVLDPTVDGPPVRTWLATALGELLRGELASPGRLHPQAGDTVAELERELELDRATAALPATLARLHARTPAQLLVEGTARGEDPIALEVKIVDVMTGSTVIAEREAVGASDLAAGCARLGQRLRHALGVTAADDATGERPVRWLPADPQAARLYAEGLARSRAHDYPGAVAALERAVAAEPAFGLAHLALYQELSRRHQRARAAVEAQRAFELGGGMSSTARLRAEAYYRESRQQWSQAADLWSALLASSPDDVGFAVELGRTLSRGHQIERCFEVLDGLRQQPQPVGDDPRLDLQETFCARVGGDFRRALSAATRSEIRAAARGARSVRSAALRLVGEMLANAGEYPRALEALERARKLHAEADDPEELLEALRQIAFVRSEQGDAEAAQKADREALALARDAGDRLSEGIILNDLGQVVANRREGLQLYQQALDIAHSERDDHLITALLLNIANARDDLGETEAAVRVYREVVERATGQHDDENLATAQMNLASSLDKLGQRREAIGAAEVALKSFERRGDQDGVGFALATRGDLRWGAGDLTGARQDLEAALALRLRLHEESNLAASREKLARLDIAEERAHEAEQLAREAVTERRSEKRDDRVARALLILARSLAMQHRGAEALAAVDEAERLAKADPGQAGPMVNAMEVWLVRGLAEPAAAAEPIRALRGLRRQAGCPECPAEARLSEAEILRAAGRDAEARRVLAETTRYARAASALDVLARARRLLGQRGPAAAE